MPLAALYIPGIFGLLVFIIIIGVIATVIPMDATFKRLLYIICVILLIFWLVYLIFGSNWIVIH